ncbi:MAG: competence/damage-inducible protein A [Rhodoferax sp.]
MQFGAIIIGDEILGGKRQDQHLAKAIELLGDRGLSLSYAHYVGDDPQRITRTLREAFASGDVVFSFGGIGATPDDHTRQCAAQACGRPLELHAQAAALVRERMADMAREQGLPYEPERDDNVHRLNMAVFPAGAGLIPNPFNKIAGFFLRTPLQQAVPGPDSGGVYFVPGFPVMAWPMVEWVLDQHYAHCFARGRWRERSVIVRGAMESTLTPLMQTIEAQHAVKVFSLPSVDHPQWGRHIELGVKGEPQVVDVAFGALRTGLQALGQTIGTELVRDV